MKRGAYLREYTALQEYLKYAKESHVLDVL
jgi:hypothetical protein